MLNKGFSRLVVLFGVVFVLGGCGVRAYGPAGVGGLIGTAKGPGLVGASSSSAKTGKACSRGILLFVSGDASIDAAKANGGITEVSTVDYETTNILGLFATHCTIVKGK